MIELSDKVNGETEHYVISIENLVYESHISGMYVLLPNGDNFAGIKQLFQDIINNKLQRDLKNNAKKIVPLVNCTIKTAILKE